MTLMDDLQNQGHMILQVISPNSATIRCRAIEIGLAQNYVTLDFKVSSWNELPDP